MRVIVFVKVVEVDALEVLVVDVNVDSEEVVLELVEPLGATNRTEFRSQLTFQLIWGFLLQELKTNLLEDPGFGG